MKATEVKISKSAVMTRAWSIFKSCQRMFPTFSLALERAWEVEKANVVFRIKQEEESIQKAWYKENEEAIRNVISNSMGCPSSYYGNGAYSGD